MPFFVLCGNIDSVFYGRALSRELVGELQTPLRIGIGIHAGSAVVGEMGYGGTHGLTAVGDTVNTASRLEALTKQYGCELVVSELVVECAGLGQVNFPRHEITVRNREQPLVIVVVDEVRHLTERIPATEVDVGRPDAATRPAYR
jgi:adenylate cyclase